MQEAKKEITGRLHALKNESTGAYSWVVAEPRARGGELIWALQKDDILTVFDAAKTAVRWHGAVDIDPTIRHIEGLSVNQFGPPTAQNIRAAKGFQRDLAGEWADMFLHRLPAKLERNPGQDKPQL